MADESRDPFGDPLLMVDITVTEFVGGNRTNEMKLHRTGTGDYLTVAERVLNALARPRKRARRCDFCIHGVTSGCRLCGEDSPERAGASRQAIDGADT